MPPTDRFVISFAAEPPQERAALRPLGRHPPRALPGRLPGVDTEGEDFGEAGEIAWFPDRTYAGRTYVPAVARTTTGFELFGFVSFTEGGRRPADEFEARADFTAETAETNPDWKLDLNDDVVGRWRGERGNAAEMTLVWGVPLIPGGALVTAELANLAVDQCELIEERFTLMAPDNYRVDFVDVKLWDQRGNELASESLYVDEDEDEDDEDDADEASAGADDD